MKKIDKILFYSAIPLIFLMAIGVIVWDHGSYYGPYKVTLYTGGSQDRTWIVPDRPETASMGSGFVIKTDDGQKITMSGNVVIEPAPKEPKD